MASVIGAHTATRSTGPLKGMSLSPCSATGAPRARSTHRARAAGRVIRRWSACLLLQLRSMCVRVVRARKRGQAALALKMVGLPPQRRRSMPDGAARELRRHALPQQAVGLQLLCRSVRTGMPQTMLPQTCLPVVLFAPSRLPFRQTLTRHLLLVNKQSAKIDAVRWLSARTLKHSLSHMLHRSSPVEQLRSLIACRPPPLARCRPPLPHQRS